MKPGHDTKTLALLRQHHLTILADAFHEDSLKKFYVEQMMHIISTKLSNFILHFDVWTAETRMVYLDPGCFE